MIRALVNSENWIQLTSVQMARNRGRLGDFRQFDDSGFIGNRIIYGRKQFNPKRRPPRWRAFIVVILIFIVLLVSLWKLLDTRLQKYTLFTNATEVAELTILKTRVEHQLSILVTRYDANGFYQKDNSPHLIQGDKVLLKYEYISVPTWLEFSGLHSGYILLSLQAYNNDGTADNSLNFNKADEDNSVLARIEAFFDAPQYGHITLMPSRSIHRVCISPTGQLYEVSTGC